MHSSSNPFGNNWSKRIEVRHSLKMTIWQSSKVRSKSQKWSNNPKKNSKHRQMTTVSNNTKNKIKWNKIFWPEALKKYAPISSPLTVPRTRSTFQKMKRLKLTWIMYSSELQIDKFFMPRFNATSNRLNTLISNSDSFFLERISLKWKITKKCFDMC